MSLDTRSKLCAEYAHGQADPETEATAEALLCDPPVDGSAHALGALIPVVIRLAHPSEYDLVLGTWTNGVADVAHSRQNGRTERYAGRYVSLPTDTTDGKSTRYVSVGRHGMMAEWMWYGMHREWVRQHLQQVTIDVAHPTSLDEAMGWVAYNPPGEHPLVIHFVHVIPAARKRGVGARLLRHVLAKQDSRGVRLSHLNEDGRSLIASVVSDERAKPRQSMHA